MLEVAEHVFAGLVQVVGQMLGAVVVVVSRGEALALPRVPRLPHAPAKQDA